jgi:hypothetical protein
VFTGIILPKPTGLLLTPRRAYAHKMYQKMGAMGRCVALRRENK